MGRRRSSPRRRRDLVLRDELTTETSIDRGSAVGGWALIVGAAAFGLFWGLAPTSFDDSVSWVPGLVVHAVSVLSVAAGLALLAGGTERPHRARVLATIGAALTFVGSVAVSR